MDAVDISGRGGSTGHITRRSLTALLRARATYQFYLNLTVPSIFLGLAVAVAGLLLAADLLLFSLVILLAKAAWPAHFLVAAAMGFSFAELGDMAAQWALSVLTLAAAVPIGIYVFKRAYEDGILALLVLALLSASIAVWAWYQLGGIFAPPSAKETRAAILALGYGALVPVVLLHCLIAGAMRLGRMARLSARAPRVGLRSVLLKYAERNSGRLPASAGIIGCGLGWLLLRSLVVIVLYTLVLYPYDQIDPGTLGVSAAVKAVAPVLIATLFALAVALRDIATRDGLRFLNVLLFGSLLAFAQSTFAVFLSKHGMPSTRDLADVEHRCLLPILITVRGWLFAPLREMVERLRRILMRTASAVMESSRQPPILLLRSFADDQTEIQASFASFAFAFGGKPVSRLLEEIIAEALFARGPVIAFADPRGGPLPPLGAARDRLADSAWQPHMLQHIEDAQLIVAVLGRTPSFAWELEQAAAGGAAFRILVVLGPQYPADRSLCAASPQLAAIMGIDAASEAAQLGDGVRVIVFDAKQRCWTAIRTAMGTEAAYLEAIRVGSEMMRDGSC